MRFFGMSRNLMQLNGKNVLKFCVILGDIENDVVKITENLIGSNHRMNLFINQ